jgi:glycosyltransferase involved in cell wall biosynthesis
MNAPEISIVLPAYNCEAFLTEAIESILNQTLKDFELIIINDGSTDKTEDVVKSFSDARIIYLKNETNSGLVYTLNKGIDIAKGKYIARMDGDDISLPTRLAKQKAILDENPSQLQLSLSLMKKMSPQEIGNWIKRPYTLTR